jgi:glycosyltransferase involved in cell wall biosynthesis
MAISQAEARPSRGGFRHLLRGVARFFSPRRLRATWRFARGLAQTLHRRRNDKRLTVGVDINSFYEPLTGVGWYLLQLLSHLAERDDLGLRLYGQGLVEEKGAPALTVEIPTGPAIERVLYEAPDGLVVPPWRANQLLRRLAPLLVSADSNRVLFSPNYLAPQLFRFANGARVAMIHDLALYKVPWTVRPDSAAALRTGLERALFESDTLLTPSEAVRCELIERGIAPGRVLAVHHGPGHLAAMGEPPAGTPPRYVLFVGTLEPRKNLPLLLAAWRLLRARGTAPPPLVLAGGLGWSADQLRHEVDAATAEGWLHALGYVGPQELAGLYRRAQALALPSLYEGFGLPVVEALAAGTPLLLADLPVLREVGGDAALYAPLDDPEGWADQAHRLLTDDALRSDLARRALRRRAHFDWSVTATATVRLWAQTGGGSTAAHETA